MVETLSEKPHTFPTPELVCGLLHLLDSALGLLERRLQLGHVLVILGAEVGLR